MRFCKFCGQQIPDDAEFCKHCGRDLNDDVLTADAGKILEKLSEAELSELTELEAVVTRGVKMRTGLLVWGIILILLPTCLTTFLFAPQSDEMIFGWIGVVLSIGPAAMIIGAIAGYAKQKEKVKDSIARIAELKAKRGY